MGKRALRRTVAQARTKAGWRLAVAAAAASCGGTSGLILGELPVPDAGSPGATFDAGCFACTESVTWSDASNTLLQGADTGTGTVDTCPTTQALVGYTGFLTPPSVGLILVGGIQGICGEMFLGGSSNQVATASGVSLPLRGTSKDQPWTQMCPANEVVVGFMGRSGAALDQVAFECAPWLAPDDGGTALSVGTRVTLAAAGGDGGTAYRNLCPIGELAVGSNLRSGEWIDAFGLVCAKPALVSDGGVVSSSISTEDGRGGADQSSPD